MLDIISILLNLLRLLWSRKWCILENIPRALEKNLSSAGLGWNVPYVSVKSNYSNVSFKTTVSFLIFYLDYLSTDVSGVLKSPTIIVSLLIFSFMSVNICFVHLVAPMSSACCVLCLVAQSCVTLVTSWTVAHQAPLSMGILQARTLEWVAMPTSRGSSQPRDWTQVSCIAGRFFTSWATRETHEYWSG